MGLFHKNNGTIPVHTQIGESGVLDGSLTSNDNIKIDGRVEGSVSTRGDIIVSETGYVGGGLYGCNLYIEGEVCGGAIARETLVLANTAKVSGKIEAAQIQAEEGAQYDPPAVLEEKDQKEEHASSIAEIPAKKEEPKPAAKPKKSAKPAAPEFIAKPDTPEIENVTIQTISESKQEPKASATEPTEKKPLSEEEEKEAFLKTFFFRPEPEQNNSDNK